jgi:hypothetical protein
VTDKWEIEIDIQMMLEDLEKIDPACATIIKMYTEGYNIKNIGKKLKMSRFKVKKRLDKGLEFIKEIDKKEKVFTHKNKIRKRRG